MAEEDDRIVLTVLEQKIPGVAVDQEPITIHIQEVAGLTHIITFSHTEHVLSENRADIWVYGFIDTLEGDTTEITWTAIPPIVLDPPFSDTLEIVFHQPDSSLLREFVVIRTMNADPDWINYSKGLSGLPGNRIEALISDGEGGVWMGTDKGIVQFDGENTMNLSDNLFQLMAFDDMTFDNNGDLWVGSNGQAKIAKHDGSSWTVYDIPTADQFRGDVHAIAAGIDGKIWVGTHGGELFSFDGADWVEYASIDSASQRYIESIVVDTDGHVWVSGVYGLMAEWDGSVWKYHESPPNMTNLYVSSMARDSQGNLWVADLHFGLRKYDGNSWTSVAYVSDDVTDAQISHLSIDSQDNIWAVSKHGLSKYDGASWTNYNYLNSGLVSGSLWSITIDALDQIWVGSLNFGLTLFKNGH